MKQVHLFWPQMSKFKFLKGSKKTLHLNSDLFTCIKERLDGGRVFSTQGERQMGSWLCPHVGQKAAFWPGCQFPSDQALLCPTNPATRRGLDSDSSQRLSVLILLHLFFPLLFHFLQAPQIRGSSVPALKLS